MIRRILLAGIFALGLFGSAVADETCQSPFLPKVTGQEDYIYVWTLGVKGIGDGNEWTLNNFAESRFLEDRVSVRRERRFAELTGMSPELLSLTVVRPEALNRISRVTGQMAER